jgi:hypothetical protein
MAIGACDGYFLARSSQEGMVVIHTADIASCLTGRFTPMVTACANGDPNDAAIAGQNVATLLPIPRVIVAEFFF